MDTATGSQPRATYVLPLPAGEAELTPSPSAGAALPAPLLLGNARWFIQLRWVVIALLAGLGAAGLLTPGRFHALGLRPPSGWPWMVAGPLLLVNLAALRQAREFTREPDSQTATRNLWAQILADLLGLTVVVHVVGSLETPSPFLYLAHIVLACIFFSRRQSLAVAATAAALYTGCLALERSGVIVSGGLYLDPGLRQAILARPIALGISVVSPLAIAFLVWLLASRLSEQVRRQERELAAANRRLTRLQQEKTRHMLRTTHELKAPFAAIAANSQLLLKGHCGALSDEAVAVVQRIASRCARLAVEIQEMLQLANLQSEDEQPPATALDVAEVTRWAIARVGATAQERRVLVEEALSPAWIVGVEDHLKMLLANVLANAVVYSTPGGRVRVSCATAPSQGPTVQVEDEGIGITAEKLPRIFDDYYRTEEAVRHNRDSTGLGLAIVRHVARGHGIRVEVASAPGRGTCVTLRFPSWGRVGAEHKGATDGVPAGRG